MLSPVGFADGKTHWIPAPCGKCIACRVNRSEEWAGRIQCEYENACEQGLQSYFVTLTYNDYNLPENSSLKPKDLQDFLKRLRSRVGAFRYFACGEYGGKNGRPHYHLCVFISSSYTQFLSHLQSTWMFGFVDCKLMHRNSPKYISKYLVKVDSRDFVDKVQPFFRASLDFGKYKNRVNECISDIRRKADVDQPATYRDILNVRHPYPRRVVSKSFSDKEKEDNYFKGYFDDRLQELYRKSGSSLSFEKWRIAYIKDQEENQELYYFKKQFFKK